MSEANAHRGEVEIDLGAAGTFVLRPDFEAVAAIDEQLGGVVAVAEKAFREPASLTIAQMAAIVSEGMKGQARKEGRTAAANPEKVARMLFDAGLPNAIGPCIAFLGNAITGGVQIEAGNAGND